MKDKKVALTFEKLTRNYAVFSAPADWFVQNKIYIHLSHFDDPKNPPKKLTLTLS